MTSLIEVTPNYEPKINTTNDEKVDMNIGDLQNKFPKGCNCCGKTYLPKKYSSLIAQHFNTAKHKKQCLTPANQLFKEEFGSSTNVTDAFDSKCKENRELKKLNYEYKDAFDKLNARYEILVNLNIQLQEKMTRTSNNVVCENLIEF